MKAVTSILHMWNLTKSKLKSLSVPHCISMAIGAGVTDNSSSTATRTFANTPKAISNLSKYFASVFLLTVQSVTVLTIINAQATASLTQNL